METRLVKIICAFLFVTTLSSQAKGQAKIYWSQQAGSDGIKRANLDGTDKETPLPFGAQYNALDVNQGLIYLATPADNRILYPCLNSFIN